MIEPSESESCNIEMPLSFGAKEYSKEVERRRLEILERMSKLPVAALIWGPNSDTKTPISETRLLLKETLIRNSNSKFKKSGGVGGFLRCKAIKHEVNQ
jgi:hypothetical protein